MVAAAKKSRLRSLTPSESYLALVRSFPLRPIRDAAEYETASRILDRLAVRGENNLDAGEADYLDALTLFFEHYDQEHHPIPEQGMRSPIENLKFLMEQNAMKTVDLGRLLGNRGLASLILNGKRELSKTHIRLLAYHFAVSAALFI